MSDLIVTLSLVALTAWFFWLMFMSTHKPLTPRERFWATALGLGRLMKDRPKDKGRSKKQSIQILHGLKLLEEMMTDELEAELDELVKRNSEETKDVLKKIISALTDDAEEKKEESMWPEVDKAEASSQKPEDSQPEDIEQRPDDSDEPTTFAA